ncbi:PDZ domain-containing protein [Magnetococcus sp. PR-3]|uniref:PDZ domain-containing protein n=1 Tax=Magnetococcus sp. PR-3 TaxID=3120355 RepID=UPI002FCE367A
MKKPLRLMALLTIGLLSSSPAVADGWLGATINTPKGVQVGEIIKDSPADKAGLERNDIILELNGHAIRGPGQFARRVATTKPGTRVTLKVMRQGNLTYLKTTLEDSKDHGSVTSYPNTPMGSMMDTPRRMMRNGPFGGNMHSGPRGGYGGPGGGYGEMPPPPPPGGFGQEGYGGSQPPPPPPGYGQEGGFGDPMSQQGGFGQGGFGPENYGQRPPPPPPRQRMAGGKAKPWLGVAVENTPKGIVVEGVAPTSPAAKGGLKEGDLIQKVNQAKVTTDQQLIQEINKLLPGQKLSITYKRAGKVHKVDVDVAARPRRR